jgi:hypothetical protein
MCQAIPGWSALAFIQPLFDVEHRPYRLAHAGNRTAASRHFSALGHNLADNW